MSAIFKNTKNMLVFPEIFAYALNEFSPLTTLNNTYTFVLSKLAFTCSKSALEPLKEGVKLDQS